MSKDNRNPQNGKQKAAKTAPAKPVPEKVKTADAKPVPEKIPPLFRKIDWLVLIISFVVVWGVYLFTLAPELTLEDCGELCTASYYAGIPHPPGYPFWSIYSWFWTAILPFGNVTWRVEVGESFALAMACGLVGFMVSRGSSMLMEGIEELKGMTGKWENAICIVCGIVAGLLLGFDAFVWNEAVVINRISIFDVPWLMLVALCLLRWIYAPHQRRYLYTGMFFFGLCFTIHQTMLVAAMGIEVAVAATHLRYGRSFFLANSMVYLMVIILAKSNTIPAINALSPVFVGIFHAVGIASIAAYIWTVIATKETALELIRDGSGVAFFLLLAAIPSEGSFCGLLAIIALAAFFYLAWDTRRLDAGWVVVLVCLLLWVVGISFYLYEPIAGMTNPPMEWGYPRTLEGFWHALSRGQYQAAEPTDIIHDPGRFMMQLGILADGLASSFSLVYIFMALLPFFFLFKMQKRERAWLIGLVAIYFCVGILLTIIMNTSPDRQSADENKVFFAASHAVVAILIGYGLALMTAYMATHYEKFRRWGLAGGAIAIVLAFYSLMVATGKLYFGPAGEISLSQLPHWVIQAFAKYQYGSPVFANLILLATPIIFVFALVVYHQRGPVLIALCLFAAAPVYSELSHWYKSEQRNHWFGYWFGHDMFTPPFGIYPEMARNAILFGGTDPGRFCPTYIIFCESFIPHRCQPVLDQKFDRRDVYIITQNALADGTYLDYIRAQYNRSSQNALGLDTPFFRDFTRYILTIPLGQDSLFARSAANIAYNVLDVPFTKLGAHIEARRRAEGVYPANEIYIPTPEDSQDCFENYRNDAARRARLNQLRPGEDVKVAPDGRTIEVSGNVAVMMINGLLCKVIFDHNPTNEFYVEESFPLDWMYPYETPSGIIMKINRNPLPSLSDDILNKDHEFWSKYSERLIGNWITYDTSVKEIADFAEKVYIGNNYKGFKGDPKFVRDDDAQKAFSKLRSSIAGVYAWRLSPQCPTEYQPKNNQQEQALIRETDFAFKQAFAFCPYSPEAVFRYINFLLQFNRIDDALIVAQTCLKLDPFNDQTRDLVNNLETMKKQYGARVQFQEQLQKVQSEAMANPSNFQNILTLGSLYSQLQDTNRTIELFRESEALFNQALANPHITSADLTAMAQIAARIGDFSKLEPVLEKLVVLTPNQPETYYDLAVLKAILGKNSEALQNLKIALDLSAKRLLTDPSAHDLLQDARSDPHFNSLRNLPEFQKIVPPE